MSEDLRKRLSDWADGENERLAKLKEYVEFGLQKGLTQDEAANYAYLLILRQKASLRPGERARLDGYLEKMQKAGQP